LIGRRGSHRLVRWAYVPVHSLTGFQVSNIDLCAGSHYRAFTVVYLLTGSVLAGSLVALVEPACNTLLITCMKRSGQTGVSGDRDRPAPFTYEIQPIASATCEVLYMKRRQHLRRLIRAACSASDRRRIDHLLPESRPAETVSLHRSCLSPAGPHD